jgi:toxin ParE1/3/4
LRRLQFTPAAERDLDQIWQFTLERWGKQQASRYLGVLRSSCLALARGDTISQSAEHIRQGYRKARSGKHILYFRDTHDAMVVVRILHERMDPDFHL